MTTRLRAIVVDDAPVARERLQELLDDEPDVDVVAACATGREAVEVIESARPDLVFLDLEMPEMDGFEVIQAVGPDRMPAVIFVTAYDEYAVQAFDVHALDYLLKPFSRPRFRRALDRARAHLERARATAMAERVSDLVKDAGVQHESGPRLKIRSGLRVFYVPVDQIDWIESDGNYVKLHAGERCHLYRETMERVLDLLGRGRFMRIHRGHSVNVSRVQELRSLGGGHYEVVLRMGAKLALSRLYREALQKRLAGG
jgi:two-component system LytT family response regulator